MGSKFIISLDFELFWGVQDKETLDGYGKNVQGVWVAVPQILDVFEQYGIHATWATVGFMFAENFEDVKKYFPDKENLPSYNRGELSCYNCFAGMAKKEELMKYFYAPTLIKAIAQVKGQEIGSHSFSHYYCDEAGQTPEQFRADMQAAIDIAEAKGYELKSFVFPRNQSKEEYVDVLRELGFSSYRAMANNWIHHKVKKGILRRALRLLDVYFPLTGANAYSLKEESGICNFPGSNMLKPKSKKLFFIEWLKVLRIKKQMTKAAKKGLIYHLWWHPHNFGVETEYHIKQLKKILEHHSKLDKKYGMQSLNMQEAVGYFKE